MALLSFKRLKLLDYLAILILIAVSEFLSVIAVEFKPLALVPECNVFILVAIFLWMGCLAVFFGRLVWLWDWPMYHRDHASVP